MEYICGFTKLMESLYADLPKVERLSDMVTDWSIGTVERFAEIGAHGVIIGDDWGSQLNVYISVEMWRQVFKPRYRRIVDAAHRKGLDVFFHSCGNVFKVIGELIDCGIDVMNTWQPKVIGIDKLAEHFAGEICFQCSADLQQTLPSATTAEVREETRYLIESLSSPRGGLIGVDYAGSTVSVENVDAMLEVFREYGRYPENSDR
jgi:uroporphyrinogen decarboxylase